MNLAATLPWPRHLPHKPKCKHTHTLNSSVCIWHHIEDLHHWVMKYTNYLQTFLQLSLFSPRVKQIVFTQHMSGIPECFFCVSRLHVGNIKENTLTRMHDHTFHSTAPRHCWYHTRLYGTPQHIKAQWQLTPAVVHCCNGSALHVGSHHWGWSPNLRTDSTTESTEPSQAKNPQMQQLASTTTG